MAAPNTNYNGSVAASTWETWISKQPSDVIMGDLVLFRWLKKHGQVTKKGGRKLIQPISYRKSTAVGSYDGWDMLDISPQETLTMAEVDWKQYYLTVTINGREMMMNRGEAEMLDLLESRKDQAVTSLADLFDQHIFLDGTANGGKNLTGLAAMILNSGTYAGINRSVDVWWKSQVDGTAGALALRTATGLARIYNDASNGQGRMSPNLLLTTQIIYEAFEALMDTNMRYGRGDDGPALQGFELKYKNADVVYDDYCPAGYIYGLNSKTIKLVVHSERGGLGVSEKETGDQGDFRVGKMIEPADQDAFVGKGLWMGNLICVNPRFNFVRTGINNT